MEPLMDVGLLVGTGLLGGALGFLCGRWTARRPDAPPVHRPVPPPLTDTLAPPSGGPFIPCTFLLLDGRSITKRLRIDVIQRQMPFMAFPSDRTRQFVQIATSSDGAVFEEMRTP